MGVRLSIDGIIMRCSWLVVDIYETDFHAFLHVTYVWVGLLSMTHLLHFMTCDECIIGSSWGVRWTIVIGCEGLGEPLIVLDICVGGEFCRVYEFFASSLLIWDFGGLEINLLRACIWNCLMALVEKPLCENVLDRGIYEMGGEWTRKHY